MSDKFLPTPEQKNISDIFVASILFGESDMVLPVEAPAGTGKTQLTASFMKDLEKHAPEKRVGYFIFNSFMKDEINKRAYAMDIHNTSFYTYHSFLLQHALKNEEISPHFHDKEGNILIDFAKQGYSKEEASRSVEVILKAKNQVLMSDFLLTAFNEWLNSDESLMEFSVNTINKIYRQEEYGNDEVEHAPLPEPYQRVQALLEEFEGHLADARQVILGRVAKPMSGGLPLSKIGILFLAQGMTHLLKTNKLSHSAYYKEVYNIALKEKIDLFKDFDAIIVDEAQDMDKVFKRLIELSNKPTMVIGDRSQSIYGWRGAVNMMEEVGLNNDVHSLSYSFRYDNDIAQLSNLLLLEKETAPAVLVSGKYTDSIKNIQDELTTPLDMAEIVMETINRRLFLCEQFEGLSPQDMNPKDLRKFLAQEKVAFISRNNSTLIDTIFNVLPHIRNFQESENMHISLTDTVSADFDKIKKCDFGTKTNKKIAELTGTKYGEYAKDKTLEALLQDNKVRDAIFENNKINFLLDSSKFENFKFLMRQLSPRGEDFIKIRDCDFGTKINKIIANESGFTFKAFKKGKTLDDLLQDDIVRKALSKSEKMEFLLDKAEFENFKFLMGYATEKGENFLELKDCDFGTETNKRITALTGIPFKEYKKDRNLDELLQDDIACRAIAENGKINFLLDNEKYKSFVNLMDTLSPRSSDSISKSDELANFVFTTVHGSKGKEYKYTFVASDILKPDNDGIITQEEYNIAYVALTRTKGKLYFMEGKDGHPHPLNEFFLQNKERLLSILQKDYTYTFPYGVDMTISKVDSRRGDGLYTHTFKEQNGNMNLFMINEPISMGMVGYHAEESTMHIKFRDQDRKPKLISFDGQDTAINQKDNVTYYYYGVGKTKDTAILDKKKVKSAPKVEAVAPRA